MPYSITEENSIMKKRILSLMLAVLMLSSASSLTACSESAADPAAEDAAQTTPDPAEIPEGDEAAAEEEEETLSEIEQRQLLPDNLPEVTFDGQEFRVLTRPGGETGFDYSIEIVAEELTGDACNDAVYNRNLTVEDRFDTKISVMQSGSPHQDIKTFVTAGTPDYDIVGFHDYLAYVPINAGVLMDWTDVPNVDLTQPWHNRSANDGATLNNILYAICSDLSISSMTFTYAIFANADLLTDYGYSTEDIYNLIRENEWTIDKMIEITSAMYVDKNGNGKTDKDDVYGFGYKIENPADVWMTAFGSKVCEITNDTQITVTFMTEKNASIIEKLVNWHYTPTAFNILSADYEEQNYFLNNKLVMAPLRFFAAYNQLRDMEATYIMLPYPKWDTAQEGYYTNADDQFTVFGLPLTSEENIEFVTTIYEALCAESYKQVFPIYYDTALKGKYSSDPTTAEMVELVMEGRAFDFSFQFGESVFQRLCYKFRDMLLTKSTDLASAYAKVEKALDRGLNKTLKKAYKMEE